MITYLNLRDNALTAVRPELGQLAGLTHLDLANNELQEIHPIVGKLEQLKFLDVSDNQLTTLPTELCMLKNLTVFKASTNKLETLECLNDFQNMEKLEELILHHNRLKSVNPQIGFMQNLRTIDLSHNQLTTCPKQIGWLEKSLRKLVLNANQIKFLPGDMTFLNPALRLELDQNPLDPVIAMNYKKGVPSLLDSLAQLVQAYPEHCVAYGDALVGGRVGVGESFHVKGIRFAFL